MKTEAGLKCIGISQGMPRMVRGHQKLGSGKEGFFAKAFLRSMVLPIP